MNVSPDVLRRETVTTLSAINEQLEEVRKLAAIKGTSPSKLVNEHGNWIMPALLLGKAQCLAVLVQLNEPRYTREGPRPSRRS